MSQNESQDESRLTAPSPVTGRPPLPENLFLLDPTNKEFISKRKHGLITRTRVILLVIALIVIVPLLILFEGLSTLNAEMMLASSSAMTRGEITNHRSALAGNRGQVTNYYVTYRFHASNQDMLYTNEQLVSKSTYDHLSEGAAVDINYVPANPQISTLGGANIDGATHDNGYLLAGIGLVGTLLAVAFAFVQISRLYANERLRHSGKLLIGHVNRCTGKLKVTSRSFDSNDYGGPLRGNYMIEVYYRFRTPTNHEIRNRETRKRNDLLNMALPAPDSPLAVLYLDDKHYEVL